MYKNIKVLAIIPARGGSKRIPHKNIRDFLGKPIIAYSIKTAIDSKLFDEIMVSTDDKEIAKVAVKYGAKVPFFRTAKNSNDKSTTVDVVREVLSYYKNKSIEYDYVCCIYSTAPFVTPGKLKDAFNLLKKSNADSILTIVQYDSPIQRSFKIVRGLLKMNWPKNMGVRSQDLESSYHDAGQFYFFKVNSFLKQKKLFMSKTIPIIVSELEAQDIDNEEDWKMAELKYKILEKHDK